MKFRILRLHEVKNSTGLSRSTIYGRMSDGTFPKHISLGPRTVGWLENEIQDWLQRQIQTSRSGQPTLKENTTNPGQCGGKTSCGESATVSRSTSEARRASQYS